VAANHAFEDVVPARELRAAQQRVKELERALGKKAMEVEILQAARDEVKKKPRWYGASKR
jgi:transposase